MKKVFLFLLLNICLFASQNYKNMNLIQLFNTRHYSYICNRRWIYINKYFDKREDLLSLVAYSCLKKRFLTPALDLAKVLKTTKEGRKNATYITTLFLMKKLIIQIIKDNMNIKGIKLPEINDCSLGIVFFSIENGKYKKSGNSIEVNYSHKTYKVTLAKNYNVIIEIFQNGKMIKREYYW